MFTFDQLIERLDVEIANIPFDNEPKLLYEPIRYLLEAGGKRLRPALVLMSHNLFSEKVEDSMPAAVAIELFHNFTLLHDDIMDNSDTRRGRMTVNVKWDDNVAILSGDTMTIMAYKYLSKTPQSSLLESLSIFNDLAIDICEGQRYDMDFEAIDHVTLDQYINMIRLKTSVLMAGALKIGAVIGGANRTNAKDLYDLGIVLGLAFQLSDDMLDTYGDQATFGKRIGGDIMEGKKTFLLIHTLSKADVEQRKEILSFLRDKSIEREAKISGMKSFYAQHHAKEAIESKIQDYYFQAVDILNRLDVEPQRKTELRSLCKKMIERKK